MLFKWFLRRSRPILGSVATARNCNAYSVRHVVLALRVQYRFFVAFSLANNLDERRKSP